MPVAWVPPVYEATGGYAAPSPCLSPALWLFWCVCQDYVGVFQTKCGEAGIFRYNIYICVDVKVRDAEGDF